MNRRSIRLLLLVALLLMAIPLRSPAPLIYRPGEGWSYEPVGGEGKWRVGRAKDQLDIAQSAFDKKDYSLAMKAAKRVVKVWPLSDYAPQAQYLVARSYEAKGKTERAFKEYQKVLEKYPKFEKFEEILQREFQIADLYLAGKWFHLWGIIPLFPSMEKTAKLYEDIVKDGPFSEVGPQAQLKVGAAREKQKNYPMAVKAFELAADRYHDRPQLAAEALFREGMAYQKQAQTAEYDQNTASEAIATFSDFMALYPGDARVPQTQRIISDLRREQARGSFQIAKFYERYKKWKSARIYYGEVNILDPESAYAVQARARLTELDKKIAKVEAAEAARAAAKKK